MPLDSIQYNVYSIQYNISCQFFKETNFAVLKFDMLLIAYYLCYITYFIIFSFLLFIILEL